MFEDDEARVKNGVIMALTDCFHHSRQACFDAVAGVQALAVLGMMSVAEGGEVLLHLCGTWHRDG